MVDLRIAQPVQLAGIPIPQGGNPALDALQGAGNALLEQNQRDQATDQQVTAIEREAALREHREQQNLAVATGAANLANVEAQINQTVSGLRNDPTPGAVGHQQRVAQAINQASDEFWNALPADPQVRSHFVAPMAQLAATVETREDAWQRGQAAKAQGEGIQTYLDAAANAILQNPTDVKGYQSKLATSDSAIDAMQVPEDVRQKMRRARDQQFNSAMIDGLEQAGDFGAMRQLAATPSFTAPFDEKWTANVLKRADVGERSATVAAQAQASAVRTAASQQLDAIQAEIDIGGVPDQPTINTAVANAKAAGVAPAKIVHAEGWAADLAVNRQFGVAGDPDGSKGRAAIAALDAQQQGGKPLTSDQHMLYTRLTDIRDQREKTDASNFKALLGAGTAGRAQILSQLDARPADERFSVAQKVSPGLGYFGLLPPDERGAALQGDADLASNHDLLAAKQAKPAFRSVLGVAALGLNEDAIAGYQRVADGIYASMIKGRGKFDWDPQLYAQAANQALGAHRDAKGVLRGGIGIAFGHRVLLPDWETSATFEQSIARANFDGAVYGDGSAASKADILKRFAPVYDGETPDGKPRYAFVGPDGGRLKDAKGRDYIKIANQLGAN